MSWVRFDDSADDHPKIAGLSDQAFRWWFRGCCYSNRFLLDGVLPPAFLARVPSRVLKGLLHAGLWEERNGQTAIHDYHRYQTDRATVEAKRQQTADRVKRFRNRVVTPTVTLLQPRESRESNDAPITSHPIPIREEGLRAPSSARGLIVSPLDFYRQHGQHLNGFCDWVCLPLQLVAEFAAKSGQPADTAEAFVEGWAVRVRGEWAGKSIGDDCWRFWRSRWLQQMGSTRVVPTNGHADPVTPIRRPGPSDDKAIAQSIELKRRRAELLAEGMTPADISALFDREYDERMSAQEGR